MSTLARVWPRPVRLPAQRIWKSWVAVWPAKREVLLALAEDFVDDGGRQAVAAEAADGEVIAVVDQAGDGVGDGGELVGEGRGLAANASRARSADGSAKRGPVPWERSP